jgi:hypothetical protein
MCISVRTLKNFDLQLSAFSVALGLCGEYSYCSVQNLSLRYLSPESQRMVTITAC